MALSTTLRKHSENITIYLQCLKARLHIGEATHRFLFVSLCRVQRFARVSVKLSEVLCTK